MITIEVTDKDPKRAAEIANAFAEELDKLLQGLTIQEAGGRLAFLEKERAQVNQNLAKAENTLRAFSEKNSVLQLDTKPKEFWNISPACGQRSMQRGANSGNAQQATAFNYDMIRLETEIQGLKSKLKTAENQYDQVCISDICLYQF